MYVTVLEMEGRGMEGGDEGEREMGRRGEGEKVERKRGGGVDYATTLVCLVPLQKMVWLDDKEERKRILMDLRVMTSHRSPYIVQYYGSVIWNVRVHVSCV